MRLRDGREVEIRVLTAADAGQFNPFMRQIARESKHTLRYEGQPETPSDEIARRWGEAARLDNKLYLGALFQERLIGYLLCQRTFPDHPWMNHLGYFVLMLHDEFSGQGLGRQLMRELDAYAARQGLKRMEATVRADNPRALALYRRCGFEVEGLRRQAAWIDGEPRDEHYIAKLY